MAKKPGSEYVTRKDLEEVVGAAVVEILNSISGPFTDLDGKVDKLQSKVDNLRGKVDNLENRTERIERKLDAVVTRQDEQGLQIKSLQRSLLPKSA